MLGNKKFTEIDLNDMKRAVKSKVVAHGSPTRKIAVGSVATMGGVGAFLYLITRDVTHYGSNTIGIPIIATVLGVIYLSSGLTDLKNRARRKKKRILGPPR